MKKIFYCLLLWLPITVIASSTGNDSLFILLDKVMREKGIYIKQKEQNIQNLKNLLEIGNLPLEQQYGVYLKLYKEYEKYSADSAVLYIEKNLDIANKINNKYFQGESSLLQALMYSTKGMYIESKQILDGIVVNELSPDLLAQYYYVYNRFYSHYGQSNGRDLYYEKSGQYRDSLLMILSPVSLDYQIESATKLVYSWDADKQESESYLLQLFNRFSEDVPEKALVAYLLSEFYKQQERTDLQKKYLIVSAIVDVKNSIRDNASMQSLALVYYQEGNIDMAYRYMQEAVDNATFCNVKYRAAEASMTYPFINSLYRQKEQQQRKELQSYLILISILSVALVFGILYIYKQMKRVARIRKELYHSNLELSRLNADLKNINTDLEESNHIKEEYIAHFFDLCSNYIDKMEEYRKNLNKLAAKNQLEELYRVIKSSSMVDNEVEELYKTFDSIFLNIYPTFIEGFNALLLPEERIYPKPGELLNTELRIFALIRLGIKDSVKIASFLRYSLRTVYNYRTKVRNKAAGERDEFEILVEKIGYTHQK